MVAAMALGHVDPSSYPVQRNAVGPGWAGLSGQLDDLVHPISACGMPVMSSATKQNSAYVPAGRSWATWMVPPGETTSLPPDGPARNGGEPESESKNA
jgi:hypothetical protein